MPSLTLEVLTRPDDAVALAPEWEALARAGGDGALFRGPAWALPWFRAYGGAFGATLCLVAAREEGRLVALAPFYERTAKLGPGVKSKELRLLGDAGPRPPGLDLVVAAGFEERFATALTTWLTEGEHAWDVLDLSPLRHPSRARAYLAQRLDGTGRRVDSEEAGTTMVLSLTGGTSQLAVSPVGITTFVAEAASLEKGLMVLRRVSRLEWANRDEKSPISDGEASRLLEEVVLGLGARGAAHLSRLDNEHGFATAVALVIDDAPRAVCVALAIDPEAPGAAPRLLAHEAQLASARGLRALEIVCGAGEFEPPPLPVTIRRSLRLRAYQSTAAGTLARTYSTIRRRAEAYRGPAGAAATARAAWSKIRDAASNVAQVERLHLYRGELWVRGITHPPGLELSVLDEVTFDALPEDDRRQVTDRLELVDAYCREKWRRGDLVILARLDGRPAGIAWCARAAVFVPELQRDVRPGASECYIHDVFVAPEARGKNVAPAMLEELARRLRQRDVYRAWALIDPANVASTRAFEKAAYASVADVIYARMAAAQRLVLRPPDAEGKKILGIP